MFERFTDRARKVLALAKQEAQRFNHPSIGTEHLLLGLLKEGTGVGAAVLKELGVEARHVKLEVETQLRLRPEEAAPEGELTLTPEAKQVIEYARVEAQNLNHNYVGTEHLLLGLLRASQGGAGTILRERGVSIEAARQQVLQVLGHGSEAADVSHSVAAPTTDAPPLLVADCPLCKTIQDLGSNTSFVTELPSTYVMLSDNQGCPG
jgi:ATP-dependent Clp protease ATP-binding subunit ClpC